MNTYQYKMQDTPISVHYGNKCYSLSLFISLITRFFVTFLSTKRFQSICYDQKNGAFTTSFSLHNLTDFLFVSVEKSMEN